MPHFRQYVFTKEDRFHLWAAHGMTGISADELSERDGVQYMPWGRDAAMRERAVPVLKIELADALLRAGVRADDAAAEVNAALGPPNLTRMGWGSIGTAGGRRSAQSWWQQYPPREA